MDRNELLTKINLTRGFETQSRQLSEEVGELLQAVNKLWRVTTSNGLTEYPLLFNALDQLEVLKVIKELADVQNMIDGIAILIGCSHAELLDVANMKLEREYGRLCGTTLDKP